MPNAIITPLMTKNIEMARRFMTLFCPVSGLLLQSTHRLISECRNAGTHENITVSGAVVGDTVGDKFLSNKGGTQWSQYW